MKFLTSYWNNRKTLKTAKEFAQALAKHLRYKKDLLPLATTSQLSELHQEITLSLKAKDLPGLTGLLNKGDRLVTRLLPTDSWELWREQVEVILVAVVAALAIRAYFYQPFKIPTDSMKPTLYGIQSIKNDGPIPSLPVRLYEQLVFGRAYHRLVAPEDLKLTHITGGMMTPWFEYSDLHFDNGRTERIWANPSALQKQGLFDPAMGREIGQSYRAFSKGDLILDFHTDTGDQVLVSKWIYNFRLPKRGETLVFRTTHIEGIESRLRRDGIEGSQFYIKRCVAGPGDELRIDPPLLYINGEDSAGVTTGKAMARVEAAQNGYRGYGILSGQNYLKSPQEFYTVPSDGYWAMGDNSYNSLDSRFWGKVPRENLVGTAILVWWPFGPRWGGIQ